MLRGEDPGDVGFMSLVQGASGDAVEGAFVRRHDGKIEVIALPGDPRVQAPERQAMRGKHQRLRRQRIEPRQRIQIVLHRIGLGLRR